MPAPVSTFLEISITILVNRAGIKTGLKRHSGYRGSPAVGRCVSHVNEEVGCDEYIHQWHDNTCKIKVAGGVGVRA